MNVVGRRVYSTVASASPNLLGALSGDKRGQTPKLVYGRVGEPGREEGTSCLKAVTFWVTPSFRNVVRDEEQFCTSS